MSKYRPIVTVVVGAALIAIVVGILFNVTVGYGSAAALVTFIVLLLGGIGTVSK